MRGFTAMLTALTVSSFAFAQTAEEKKATLAYIESLRDADTSAYAVSPAKKDEKLKPSLRACNGAVRAIQALGGKVTDIEKLQKFVMGCYDEKTGAFAEPGGKPDVTITSIGVLTATALEIPKEKYKKAFEYLDANCKTFDDYRIAAAAVEAYGRKESGVKFEDWDIRIFNVAMPYLQANQKSDDLEDQSLPFPNASTAVTFFRLAGKPTSGVENNIEGFEKGHCKDGGWRKPGAKVSDLEATYRVLRYYHMSKSKTKDIEGLKKFVANCRNKDGGYGVEPKAESTMSGTYYAAMILKWVEEMEKK